MSLYPGDGKDMPKYERWGKCHLADSAYFVLIYEQASVKDFHDGHR